MQNDEVVVVDDRTRLEQIAAIRSEVSAEFIRENLAQLSFSEIELQRKKVGIVAGIFPPSWLDPRRRVELARAGRARRPRPSLREHAFLLIVLHDSTRRRPASERDVLGMMSLGCVMQNLWLMVQTLGISMQVLSAMSAAHVEGELRRVLGFPPQFKVSFGARLGIPPQPPSPTLRVRHDTAAFVHHDAYRSSWGAWRSRRWVTPMTAQPQTGMRHVVRPVRRRAAILHGAAGNSLSFPWAHRH